MEPRSAYRRAELEVRRERGDDPVERVEVVAMLRDELLGRLGPRLAERPSLLEPPGRGANVEGADIELVDDQRPAWLDQLAEPPAGLLERVYVVEGDDRDRGRERTGGLVQVGQRDFADVVARRLRVDRQHVVADLAKRAGKGARSGADFEHARGRLRQVRANEGSQVRGRHPGYFFAFLACRFSFSVFCAGFFSKLFFVFLSLFVMS